MRGMEGVGERGKEGWREDYVLLISIQGRHTYFHLLCSVQYLGREGQDTIPHYQYIYIFSTYMKLNPLPPLSTPHPSLLTPHRVPDRQQLAQK